MHHLGLELGFKGLHLTKHGQAPGRAAHLALELVEHFVQPLSGGPEGWVVLPNRFCVHGRLLNFLDTMIVIADDLG
jgi:hypothetical protein